MSDVRVTGNLSGVAGIPASASEATRKVHAAVGAPPPPPPLKGAGAEGGVPARQMDRQTHPARPTRRRKGNGGDYVARQCD